MNPIYSMKMISIIFLFFAQFSFANSPISPLTLPPAVKSFSPASGKQGDPITIRGSHFTGASGVVFGTVNASSFSVRSDSVITAVVGKGSSGSVIVQTPAGTASLTYFTYIAGPPPVITSFTPASGTKGTVVTIYGLHFTNAVGIGFGDSLAKSFTIVNDSLATAVVGGGASGPVWLQVTPNPTAILDGFTYIPSFQLLQFSAANQAGKTQVQWQATGESSVVAYALRYSRDSTTFATVDSISPLNQPGASSYSWTNTLAPGSINFYQLETLFANGTSVFSKILFYAPPPPVITSFTPDSAKIGDTVTIRGYQFANATAVGFGNAYSPHFRVVTDSLITAVVGNGYGGPSSVYVGGPGGNAYLNGFTYIPTQSPFQLLQFTGSNQAGHPSLQWQTINELRITSYEVQVGTDSAVFYSIGSVQPLNQDSAVNYYTWTNDTTTSMGTFYYRLKMNELNTVLYGPVIAITLSATPPKLIIYPNPAVGTSQTVIVPGTATVPSQFSVTDLRGATLRILPVAPGTSQVQMNTAGLVKGLYKLVWSDGTHSSSQTILVLH